MCYFSTDVSVSVCIFSLFLVFAPALLQLVTPTPSRIECIPAAGCVRSVHAGNALPEAPEQRGPSENLHEDPRCMA